MRENFKMELENLTQSLIEMGVLVEAALGKTILSILKRDKELALQIKENDKDIDQKLKEIESHSIRLLLKEQPVAQDLRKVSATLKMVSDLERIGDQAADIADIVLQIADRIDIASVPHVLTMAESVKQMLHKSIKAFVEDNLELAYTINDLDDEIDNLFHEVKKALIRLIHENEKNGDYAMDVFMVAKYLEKIGDHSLNVAKWVIFSDTGIKNGINYLTSTKESLEEK